MSEQPETPPTQAAPAVDAVAAIRKSASWFYWIAGLSVVNMITMATGSNYSMILGSGISQITQTLAGGAWANGSVGTAVALYAVTGLFALAFVFFGIKGSQLLVWPFIAGMALYALDSLVFLLARDIVGIGFHAFVLYMLYRGLSALQRLKKATVPVPGAS